MQKFFTYIIECEAGRWYIGSTNNIDRRLIEHNSGQTKSTRGRNWHLIFLREYQRKTEAIEFERKLKRLRNKKYISKEFANYFIFGM